MLMARKVQRAAKASWFPIENFTNFYFKPDLSPFFRVAIFIELVLCSLCVLGTLFLAVLKFIGNLN